MAGQAITKIRLILNGAFCLGFVVLCVPVAFVGIVNFFGPAHPSLGDDDGRAGVLMAAIFAALLAAVALVSLVRTVKAWSRLRKDQ
jgi:hypothetical protein